MQREGCAQRRCECRGEVSAEGRAAPAAFSLVVHKTDPVLPLRSLFQMNKTRESGSGVRMAMAQSSGVQWGRVENGSGCELLLLLVLLKAPSLGPQPLTPDHLLQEEARKDPSLEPSETAWPC